MTEWYRLPKEEISLSILWERRAELEKQMDDLNIELEAVQQVIDDKLRGMSVVYQYVCKTETDKVHKP